MIIKIILSIIAIISGFIAIKGFSATSSIQQIYYAFNALIFVVCLGFMNVPHKLDSKNQRMTTKEELEQRIERKKNSKIILGNKCK